ncbi:type IV pilin protein [Clostridium vitabionis]|uniref:type IV pilin protein n=1 Tax=Clostridium vitabionis TaxID=2784388 RepID=UPI00188C3DB5|nr:prepilin-type N-terminal cleavage/methylation domain-containing protein [Clostridium vitabionis]
MKNLLNRKLRNKKGFTLAELLIVVAIIGVLVAISIPIFTSQLEKSRDAVTLSNIRAAYAEAQTAELTQSSDTTNGVTYTPDASKGTATVEVKGVVSKGTQEGLNNLDQLPFGNLVSGKDKWEAKGSLGGTAQSWKLTFSYDENGKITSVTAVEDK